MSSAPEPVASGCPYTVVDVSGHAPMGLDDFVGDRAFTAIRNAHVLRVHGDGVRVGSGVRFWESLRAVGNERRVWSVAADSDGDRYLAATVAFF